MSRDTFANQLTDLDTSSTSSAVACAKDVMLTTETVTAVDEATADVDGDAPRAAAESDQEKEREFISGDAVSRSDLAPDTPETAPAQDPDPLDEQQTVQPVAAVDDESAQISADQSEDGAAATEVTVDASAKAQTEPGAAPSPLLPDPSSITARLRNLVVAVGQVEELSQRAREIAANDLALYSGIAASQRQFEEGLAEAQRIGHEAQAVYQRAFGQEAKAVAEPAVIEAREVQQAFADLAHAWREQAETFLVEHPDVDALLAEQRHLEEESLRQEAARARADRFQQLVAAIDLALRQGQLNEARDYVNALVRDFPGETERIALLRERLEHRVRAANDAAARRVLLQASELQGRGDFEAAVKLLEAVDVSGLSRDASENVFGRWSAACSLLGQTGGLELLRYSPTQGRGVIVHRDPSVRYGMLVFSSLGMGRDYFEGRVVSAADREGATIMSRARPFRPAEVPPDLGGGWYGRTYMTGDRAAADPVRH